MALRDDAQDALEDLEQFEEEQYDGIDLDRLTAYGVRLLGTRRLPVTFENVVVALFRLFPGKFALVGYPRYPDAARINRAILHCFPKYKNYLTGRATTGYRLTHQGEVAADEAAEMLSGRAEGKTKGRKTARRGVADTFMREVLDSKAFKAYSAGSGAEVDFYDVARLLHATPNSPPDVLRRNMAQLVAYANETGRDDIAAFLKWALSNFKELSSSRT